MLNGFGGTDRFGMFAQTHQCFVAVQCLAKSGNKTHMKTSAFIKFSADRYRNGTGTRDWGTFQIHSSNQLFSVFFRRLEDGSTVGNYHGNEKDRLRLQQEKKDKVTYLCAMFDVGGQICVCDDGVQLADGSWLYNGSYDCYSD